MTTDDLNDFGPLVERARARRGTFDPAPCPPRPPLPMRGAAWSYTTRRRRVPAEPNVLLWLAVVLLVWGVIGFVIVGGGR